MHGDGVSPDRRSDRQRCAPTGRAAGFAVVVALAASLLVVRTPAADTPAPIPTTTSTSGRINWKETNKSQLRPSEPTPLNLTTPPLASPRPEDRWQPRTGRPATPTGVIPAGGRPAELPSVPVIPAVPIPAIPAVPAVGGLPPTTAPPPRLIPVSPLPTAPAPRLVPNGTEAIAPPRLVPNATG